MREIPVEYKRVRPIVFVGALLFTVVTVLLGNIVWLFTDKPGTFNGIAVSILWIALLNEALGRLNKRLRLSAQELVLMLVPGTVVLSTKYLAAGVTGSEAIFGHFEHTIAVAGYAQNIDYHKEWFTAMTPTFMFPKSEAAIQMFISGVRPGQAVPWGEWIAPIAFWSVLMILVYLIMMFLTFGLAGRQWVEVERLAFPLSIPGLFVISRSGEVDPMTNKSRFLNFKDPRTKVFWGAMLVGLAASIIPFLYEILPPLAILGAFAWGETPVRLEALAAGLPGSYAFGVFHTQSMVLILLLPNDVYYTAILSWIIFGVLYQGIGVMTGAIPYEPGMEFRWNWEQIPAWWPPIPYAFIGIGVAFAVGLWSLFMLRGRIKMLASTLTGKDTIEYGLSMRLVTTIGIASIILFLALIFAIGVPVIYGIVWFVLWFIWYVHMARVGAEFWWHNVDFWSDFNGWTLTYPVGAALGNWPWTVPSGGNNYAWFVSNMVGYGAPGGWVLRTEGFGPVGSMALYKIAYHNRMNLRDLYWLMLIIAIIITPFAMWWHIWLVNHGGGFINQNNWGWRPWWQSGAYGLDTGGLRPGQTFESTYFFVGLGFIVGLLLFVVRMKFAWFFINPVALVPSLACMPWIWMICLVALIIKTLGIRIVGLKRYEEYVLPAAAGVALGFGSLFFWSVLVNFFTVALPKFLGLYVP